MRVKCRRPTEKDTGQSQWLTVGKDYEVLCVYFERSQGTLLRIIGNDQLTPALFSDELFEFIDSRIPQNWVVVKDKAGTIRLSPEPWLKTGFWQRFFDKDPDAMIVFEREKKVIESS